MEALGLAFTNHGADKGIWIFRVATFQGASGLNQLVTKFGVDGFMGKDALDANAALARLVERTGDDALDGVVYIPVLVHDTGGIATELQDHGLFAGPGFELPDYFWGAGKTEQFESLIFGEQIGAVPATGQDGKCTFRQIGFREDFANDQGANGGQAGRFEDERRAHSDGRPHFVARQVQGEIERADEGTRSNGNALGHASVMSRPGTDIQGDGFPVKASGFLCSNLDGIDQSSNFS